jgi:tetratricopeptide (TPR) repeat protein
MNVGGVTQFHLGKAEEAIKAFTAIVDRLSTSTDADRREQVAKALFNKGIMLGTFGRSQDAIAVYNELLDRFGTATELALREQVAKALFNKEVIYTASGRKWLRLTSIFSHFFPPNKEMFNEPFYGYFIQKLDNARHSVYVTLEGFEGATPKGRQLAKEYHEATKRALQRGITVIRIQIRSNVAPDWANCLKELMIEFPDKFELYFPNDRAKHELVSFCIIDPESREYCVTEMMVSMRLALGDAQTNIAGTAAFLEGNQKVAIAFQQFFLGVRNSSHLTRIDVPSILDEYTNS